MKIIDAHLHFYDFKVNRHLFLEETDPNFEGLIGDYSTLPRSYLPKDYLEGCKGYQVEGVVWHEFVSTDPYREVKWAQELSKNSGLPQAMVASVEFLSPDLEEKLEFYSSVPGVASVREHLLWQSDNPAKRLAAAPDLLKNEAWVKKLEILGKYRFKCALVVFASQLPDLYKVFRRFPEIQFTLPVMGWPEDLSIEGFERWKKGIGQLAECSNFHVGISAIECIFGMSWTLEQVRPWIETAIETFGPDRCMFGSHMPISRLSRSFQDVYDAYRRITTTFSQTEKEQLFYRNAADWFSLSI